MNHRLISTAIALVALAAPSAASAADRDHDKMRDSWEKRFGLNRKKNDARKDKDRDGLRNRQEFRLGTNPRDKDSDDDGRRDGREGAGTIKSFDAATGRLVIDLFRGGDLTGTVDATTEIECEDHRPAPAGTPDDNTRAREGAEDDDRSGSNSGPGSGDRSDDDDNSGSNSGPSENSGPGNADDPDRPGDNDDDDRDEGEDRDNDDEDEFVCGTEWLDEGRLVKEAELNSGDDGPAGVFDEIELIVR